MTSWQAEYSFDDCLERLEWQVRHLQSRDREWRKAKQPQRAAEDRQSRSERAFAYVYSAGALEDLFRRLDSDLPTDLRRLEVKRKDLRPPAMAMLVPDAWDSISTDRVTRLVKRSDLVRAANDFYVDGDPLDFSSMSHMGISDGRTVNAHHFEAVWEGFCLSPKGDPIWPSHAHRQAVSTLANKRNAIAHFETDPREEAFRSSYGDLATMVERVSQSVERLYEHLLIWLDRYERTV